MRRIATLAVLGLLSVLAFAQRGHLQEGSAVAHQTPNWARDPDQTPGRIRLLVRGDDFGVTHASNQAMEQAFATGVMRSASVLPAAPWFAETAALIRSHPDWVVGLHLTITSEWDRLRFGPTLPQGEVPSLVAPDGYFFHSYPGLVLNLGALRKPPYLFGEDKEMPAPTLARRRQLTSSKVPAPAEVEAELRSQIRRARRLGVRIDYLDCHMAAACSPALRPVLIRLAAELGVPIPEGGWMGDFDVHFRVRGDADTEARQLADRLRSLRPGLHLLVLHPLVDSEEQRAVDGYFGLKLAREGQALLEALASDEIQAVIAEKSIELVSVRDLWDYDECRLKK